MVAPVVAAGAAVGAKKAADNPWPLIIVAGALVLLGKWGVGDKINILPEAKQFIPALLGRGRKGTYIPDVEIPGFGSFQTGLSPNPPSKEWWDEYGSQDLDPGWLSNKTIPPIPLLNPIGVPTAPVVKQRPRSQADIAGEQAHEWFTNPVLYPWFWLADKL